MRMLRLLSLAACTLGLAACGDDTATDPMAPVRLARSAATACPSAFQTTAPTDGQNTGFEAAGHMRSFYLQLPDAARFPGPRPLLVFFHGSNHTGMGTLTEADAHAGFAAAAKERGLIVVAPDGADLGTVWPEWDAMREPSDRARPNPDVALFDALVDCLAAHHPVDEKRIFAAGKSAGGHMANRIIRERSARLAGAVPASGVFELTEPVSEVLDPMAVMVTWGGDNDAWGGDNGGVQVAEFNFAEQGALASAHYESAAGVHQVYCAGKDLGHSWLHPINDYILDFLLAHPKGFATHPGWTFVAPASDQVTCGEAAAMFTPSITVECATPVATACDKACQLAADCVVENSTVQPILKPQLIEIGFPMDDLTMCGGCIESCRDDEMASTTDAEVVACLGAAFDGATCGPGIAGALPFATAISTCCDGKRESQLCTRVCESLLSNSAVLPFVPACMQWMPMGG